MQPTQEEVLAALTDVALGNLHEVTAREAFAAIARLQKIRAELHRRLGGDAPCPDAEPGCDVVTRSRFIVEAIDSLDELFGSET
jgi:hypothetical protein